jgi:hypothetical protein
MVSRTWPRADRNWQLETPAFRAITWIARPDKQKLAFVTLDRDREDLDNLRDRDVLIDGVRYRCSGVRTYAPGPYAKGDSIGILVAGVHPTASSSG